ncbi:DUF4123 domain-containing protein [Billgrantia sp. Q4P2]|uniref:DUF4123 domain-containing protein n=1 Tax=Billgrantia sp. Q4P2 TaxID=3463857 RepID=UPI004056B124
MEHAIWGHEATPRGGATSEYGPWMGRCFFRRWLKKASGGDPFTEPSFKDYSCYAAVWTNSRAGFLDVVTRYLEAQDYVLTWDEDVLPVVQWMTQYGYHADALTLPPRVGPEHLLEMGDFTRTDEYGMPIQETWLGIEDIAEVEPLDAQFGVHPMRHVPDTLREPLFGQPVPADAEVELAGGDTTRVSPVRTFALLDAAKGQWLQERIEESGLPFRCLFTGKAEEELKAVAPYLVELAEEHDFTRQLFTRSGFPSDLWDSEPGIFIRSRGTLEALWKHCRKFTRVRDAQGRWFHFRFWESRYAVAYYQAIVHDRERVQHWFLCGGVAPLSILAVCTRRRCAWVFAPSEELPAQRPRAPFLYAEQEREAFVQVRKQDFAWKLDKYLGERFSDFSAKHDEERQGIAISLIDEAQRFGMEVERAVADFALASVMLGRPLADEPALKHLLGANMNALNKGQLLLRSVQELNNEGRKTIRSHDG